MKQSRLLRFISYGRLYWPSVACPSNEIPKAIFPPQHKTDPRRVCLSRLNEGRFDNHRLLNSTPVFPEF